jgi:hypothetical protein
MLAAGQSEAAVCMSPTLTVFLFPSRSFDAGVEVIINSQVHLSESLTVKTFLSAVSVVFD